MRMRRTSATSTSRRSGIRECEKAFGFTGTAITIPSMKETCPRRWPLGRPRNRWISYPSRRSRGGPRRYLPLGIRSSSSMRARALNASPTRPTVRTATIRALPVRGFNFDRGHRHRPGEMALVYGRRVAAVQYSWRGAAMAFHPLSKKPRLREHAARWCLARSPYLHNGSVPTLEDLLEPPSRRVRTFWRGCDTFDQSKVGYVCTGSFLFDTRLAGNGNGGHEYGTMLTADEKRGLIEFLKTK